MYKLAVFDMDGTLLNSNHEISVDTMKALDYLKEKGVRVVIATGRPSELLKKYTNELKIDEYIITCNGSAILHPFKDDVLHDSTVDKETVVKIIDMCEENNFDYIVYTRDAVVSKDNERLRFFKQFGRAYKEEDLPNIIETEDSEYIKNNFLPNKILLLERDPEKFKVLLNIVQTFSNIEYAQSWTGALDVTPLGNTKGKAVQKVCEHYGITQEEVIAFGDQLNDISMIEYAGMGVAMGNAEDAVKKAANYIASSNDDNGISKTIYKFIK